MHRALVVKRRILHRDISKYNILMYPEHHHDTVRGKSLAVDRPTFIKQVLCMKRETYALISVFAQLSHQYPFRNNEDQSMGLLIDFDNSAKMETCPGRTEKKLGFITVSFLNPIHSHFLINIFVEGYTPVYRSFGRQWPCFRTRQGIHRLSPNA